MIIEKINFQELESEKYWSFAKSYKGDSKKETRTMITSGNYIGAEKKDGHYARFIKDMDGNMRLQGRSKSVSGEYLNKINWVPQCQEFFDSLPNGTCLLGELYFPTQRGSRKVTTILGCLESKAIERQNKGDKLHYYVFDVWAYNGKSYLNTKIENRIKTLEELKLFANNYIEIAKYKKGEELWNNLVEILNEDGEGVVITQLGTVPSPGKRTARKTLKVKKEIEQTIDAFIDGNYKPPTMEYNGKEIMTWPYWYNEKTGEKVSNNKYLEFTKGEPWTAVSKAFYNNWASAISVSVMKDEKPYHIGWISGITEEIKNDIIHNNEKLIGKVVELSAMEIENIDGKYSLRHGKIICFRSDKAKEDCTFDQISQ